MKDIGSSMENAGHEMFYAYQTTNCYVKNGYTIGNKLDWKAHALLCRVFGRQGYYSTSSTRKFLSQVDEISPDVVHLHNLHSNFINLNILLKYLAEKNIPTVITMHDCWYFTGKCFHYVDAACNRFTEGCGNCPKKNAPPASILFDSSSDVLSDRKKYLSAIPRLTVVGCSDWISSEAKKSILKEKNIQTVRNGVDISIFTPQSTEQMKKKYHLEDKFVILGMANKWLLPSNSMFLKKMLSSLGANDSIIILGCNKRQKSYLSSLDKRIIAVDSISDKQQMSQYYSMADVFVNVTHADTLPTVNMESICCGTPVITYDCCGSPELVYDGCGLVVPENDVDAVIDALHKVKEEDFKNCSDIGKAIFDKEISYRRYEDIYRDIIGR